MEGRVLWYKPSSGLGCLTSDVGRRFRFKTPGEDRAIHGGARVAFKVTEMDGDLIGVHLRVIQSGLDALAHEDQNLAREFRSVVAIDA